MPSGEPAGELGTRQALVRLLLAGGPLTAVELATRLGLAPAGVRRHLDQLLAEGAISGREAPAARPRGRGRPARAYVLTDLGRSRLPHGYDDLAVAALDFLAERGGPEAVTEFARQRAGGLLADAQSDLARADDAAGRARVVADALTRRGFAASVQEVGVGVQLCQHHCPVGHVAARYPQLCEEEFAVMSQALGTYAQRLATIARGDSFCTTFIPLTRADIPARKMRTTV